MSRIVFEFAQSTIRTAKIAVKIPNADGEAGTGRWWDGETRRHGDARTPRRGTMCTYMNAIGGGGKGPNNLPINTDRTKVGDWEKFILVPCKCGTAKKR